MVAARIGGAVTSIVLLGGAVGMHVTVDRGTPALNGAAERITEVVGIAHRFREGAAHPFRVV